MAKKKKYNNKTLTDVFFGGKDPLSNFPSLKK
jgi:hypothetical protein